MSEKSKEKMRRANCVLCHKSRKQGRPKKITKKGRKLLKRHIKNQKHIILDCRKVENKVYGSNSVSI